MYDRQVRHHTETATIFLHCTGGSCGFQPGRGRSPRSSCAIRSAGSAKSEVVVVHVVETHDQHIGRRQIAAWVVDVLVVRLDVEIAAQLPGIGDFVAGFGGAVAELRLGQAGA